MMVTRGARRGIVSGIWFSLPTVFFFCCCCFVLFFSFLEGGVDADRSARCSLAEGQS